MRMRGGALEAGEWLKNLLGAKKVNVFNHAVRKRQENPDYSEAEAMGDSSKLQPGRPSPPKRSLSVFLLMQC